MDDFDEETLANFLARQGTNFKSSLPLVHTTDAGNILRIIREDKISVTECDTFSDEKLAYFFHGRPSYRKFREKPMEWELPLVIVMNSACLVNTRRLFPFDSGAFHSGRLPDYITGFSDSDFELASTQDAIHLLIDVFFGDDTSYFHGNARNTAEITHRRRLTIQHSRIKALAALYNREQLAADDRALALEIQTDQDVALKGNIIGAVLPRPYYDDSKLRDYFKKQNVIVKHYDTYPLNTEAYMSIIYKEVKEIYSKAGFLSV